MTDPRPINPMLKMVLEIGPVALFFIAFLRLKERSFTIAGTEYEGFIIATAIFIPVILVTTAILWKLTGKLSKMQVFTAVLVTVMGGLTVWLNDDRFFKMKPTMIYLLFGILLGFGLLRGQSYLRMVLEEVMPLEHEGWMILTRRFTAFFFGLAVANEVIWRNFSDEVWVSFKTFGLPVAMFAFFMFQSGLMRRYGIDGEDEGDQS
ncbi:inner membrane-spanning protein YciB [Litorivita sp. NS0012-18]|uniref:inner membrane-spanning protein YciB n=1 Tax=Litorivita sp. NS0012-18 TaxID=3127655 RepID=UPI0031026B46